MLDLSSTLKIPSKEKEHSITNSNMKDHSISASVISDTSPVYLFCTSKNGINSKNENGWTPIYRSIIANNLLALNELLNLGSDPNISNNLGETPLYLCVDIDNYDALIILLQYNANTNIAKRNGTTPLHLATKKNKENFMHALLRNKANPNLPNKLYSQTATHIAVINKVSEEMLNIFHEYNADIYNIKDKYDKTPFDYAKELKDEDYVQLLIQIFGEENNGKNSKPSKTLNINKIPEQIRKKNEKILNIPGNFHNSNYNQLPEKISINENQEKENQEIEMKEEIKIEVKENNEIENNGKKNSEKKTEKYGILSSGDALYSDRSVSNISESNKSKIDNIKSNILPENNNLTEFQPIPFITENNEIKQKTTIIKSIKSNINIDTKMIDNSKDIIFLNNENNDLNNFQSKENNNNNFDKKEDKTENDDLNLDFLNNNKIKENDIENNINESNEENKVKDNNTDKEIIKNIISSTVKKIKVNTNTFNSEYSSLNNNSNIQNNNNSNSKVEVLKLINFSSNSNSNKGNIDNKLSNNTNLDNYININSELQNGTSSFILYNSKKTDNGQKNSNLTQNKISKITPILNKKLDNQENIDNTNILNEIQLNNLTSNQNNTTKEMNSNKELENLKTEQKSENQDIKQNNLVNSQKENNENINSNIQLTTNSNDQIIFDGSLEYSKSKSYMVNEISLNNQNNNLSNINITNNNLLNQHHRQISYHNNKSSINKKKKDGDIQNDENSAINKENDNPNNNEIIYYNKNYLAGNNSAKKFENNLFEPKNSEIQNIEKVKSHTQSDLNNMNIQRYNSITNKTNSINKKIFTYTSPNINKNTHLIKNNLINNYKENIENIDIKNKNLNNIILNTNPNVDISNLNGAKEELFSINNNLSSILNTNKFESIKDKQNDFLRDANNNSTFNVFDDIVEIKNLEKKVDLYSEKRNSVNNTNNDNNKKSSKNEGKLRNNFRGSSMGNTTFSSLTKNTPNTGKQSISSTINNKNINSSNIILTGQNNTFNNMNQSNNLIKNIPINMLLRLRDWLISCDLLCYYNLLIENNMYDIDKCITDIQNNKLKIGYKDIEDLGIRKPGHIFRLLLKLEIDAGILDNNLFNYIISKFNMSSSISNNIILTSSVSDINCCGICNKNKNLQSYVKRNDFPYNDIFSFLKYKDLWKYKENFLHNGFDQLEYILLQLFSKYTFDKELMNDCFHLYSENDKLDVLNKLYQEKKIIAKECGIESDDKEINQILSNCSNSSKYSSKKKNYYTSENSFKDTNENSYCNIF